jgi:hypothetical protein
MPDMHRIEALETTVRRQGRWLLVLGGLLTISILAAAQQAVPSGPVKVTIDKPVKIILEDVGFQARTNHPILVNMKK